MQGQIEAESIAKITDDQLARFNRGQAWLRMLGVLNYRDDRSTVRSTGVARYFHHGMKRFIPVPDDDPENDREYED
jgi:hypothetical protein